MVEYVSDNIDVKKALIKLGDILVREDAYFHPDLRVVCHDSNFSMHGVNPVENGSRVVFVPEKCQIHPNKFSFSLQNGKIVIESVKGSVPDFEQELMEMVVELYNLAGKLEQFKKTSVYSLYFEAPGLYRALTMGCIFRSEKNFETLSPEYAFLNSFLELRCLGDPKIIVPFIEYFNHHQFGQQIFINQNAPDAGMTTYAYLPPDSDEFCINYGLSSDTRTILAYEGFLDRSIRLVKSFPFEYGVENIKVAVYRDPGMPGPEDIPEGMQDLRAYCPFFDFSSPDTVIFSFLNIPSSLAPLSLRRILFYGLNKVVKDKNRATRLMQMVEHKIIFENYKYYKNLEARLFQLHPTANAESFVRQAKEMVEHQLSIINQYIATHQLCDI